MKFKGNFKKKMMVLSKKKIAAILCTALLATAGVVNYTKTRVSEPVNLPLPEGNSSYDKNTNYGEAKYVAKPDEKKPNKETKDDNIEIEKSRSEAVSLLKAISESDNTAADKKAEAQGQLIRIASDIERESIVKDILLKKGFKEVSVFMNSPGATVSVKSEGLSQSDLAKIRDTMKTDGNVLPQNLKIIETK